MPELPEVEALRRSLLPLAINHQIISVSVLLPKLVSARGTKRAASSSKVDDFIKGIRGKMITGISRRSKNLMIELQDNSLLLVHLKMTGQLVFKPHGSSEVVFGGHPIEASSATLPHKHTYIIFELNNGTLYYNDVRQFGYVLYYKSKELAVEDGHFDGLGIEPFDDLFTFDYFYTKMRTKKGILKKVFLDQKVVVGLGNIYSDEVSFEAHIKPTRTVQSLTMVELRRIYNAIQRILPRAVELGGSSVSAYLLADGSRGNYAREHKVYNRGGKPCLICGRTLTKISLAGRGTVYCEHCQK